MKKNRVLFILLIIIVTLLICGCGVIKETLNKKEEHPDVEPIILDVIISQNGTTFTKQISDKIDVESLESHFKFYGALDSKKQLYRLVQGGKKHDFNLNASGDIMVSNEGNSIPVKVDETILYVDLNAFSKIIDFKVISGENYRLITDEKGALEKSLLTGTAFRDYTKLQSEKFTNKEVQVVNKDGGFALIIIENKPYITSEQNLTTIPRDDQPAESKPAYNPIVIAWDLYGNKSEQTIDRSIDVVIPKWLSLQDEKGNINTLFRPKYTENIRRQGAKLWVLVNNAFDPDLTSKMLQSTDARQHFINSLIGYVSQNGVDGINVDFENMHLKDSDLFVQLIAELHLETTAKKIPLSVAVTVPGGSDNWSKVYDRKRLAQVSEYITLMSYDQHWASSQESGPVAGYNWVEKNIEKMLALVPKEKLVLGLPFYTRVWYETLSKEKPNTMKVKSKSVFMHTPPRLIKDKDTVMLWDEVNQQYYYAYFEEDTIVKFWYDDEKAIFKKAGLTQKYQLAGVACWSLGFEKPEVWDFIVKGIGR